MTKHPFAQLIKQPESETHDYENTAHDGIAEVHIAVVAR